MRCVKQKRKRLWASYWESSRELRCWRVPWLPSGWSARFTTICAAEPSGAVGSRWPGPLGVIAMLLVWRPLWQPIVALIGAESLFLAWWYRLKPSNDRDWDPSMAVLPRAVIAGDAVTIENVRNLEYRSIDDFEPQFEARTYHLSNIKGVDVVFFDWGDGIRGHPAMVFDFGPTAASACRSKRESRRARNTRSLDLCIDSRSSCLSPRTSVTSFFGARSIAKINGRISTASIRASRN